MMFAVAIELAVYSTRYTGCEGRLDLLFYTGAQTRRPLWLNSVTC